MIIIDIISWLFIISGGFFGITGAVGLFRFYDFYTRIHAAGIIDTLSIGLIMLGLMLQSASALMILKLLLVLFIMAYTGPTAIHALAKTARREGLEPIIGNKGEKQSTQ
jgi:multicomponent Na+:H+ antiporter subunit G